MSASATETAAATRTLSLDSPDNERLANLCGLLDEHLRQVERHFGVEVANRGELFQITGPARVADVARDALERLYKVTGVETLNPQRVHLVLNESDPEDVLIPDDTDEVVIQTQHGLIRGRGPSQQRYLKSIRKYDLCFGVGPAGTGKTFLAVASAVDALSRDQVRRIVLVRPAVEAGERLGFLPGDLAQKVDPYLRPIYDALYDMLGFDQVGRYIERHVIEVAPLAYMRGRTLNDAFVILDEAQNTTTEQMKMFLTRIGFGSRAVITGDMTQTDLPRERVSGLRHARRVLKPVEGVSFTDFTARDVVRHPLVKRIVRAYEREEARQDDD
ncbi:MAG: PhoH family protein [Gammaproteobacteria bacterium]